MESNCKCFHPRIHTFFELDSVGKICEFWVEMLRILCENIFKKFLVLEIILDAHFILRFLAIYPSLLQAL